MKTASNIFSIIGMAANVIVAAVQSYQAPAYCWIYWILAVLSVIFGIAACASSSKSIGIGVCALLFVNIFSGIFYLCWDGE